MLTQTNTSALTVISSPTVKPRPKLSELALAIEEINHLLPGSYKPPTDLTSLFDWGSDIERYVTLFVANTIGAGDIMIALFRYKEEEEASQSVKSMYQTEKKSIVREFDLSPNILPEQAWMAEVWNDSRTIMLSYNQAEIEVMVSLNLYREMDTEGWTAFVVSLGQLQKKHLEDGGYR